MYFQTEALHASSASQHKLIWRYLHTLPPQNLPSWGVQAPPIIRLYQYEQEDFLSHFLGHEIMNFFGDGVDLIGGSRQFRQPWTLLPQSSSQSPEGAKRPGTFVPGRFALEKEMEVAAQPVAAGWSLYE